MALAARKGGDVFEHGLAAVAKPGALTAAHCKACRGACFTTRVAALRPSNAQR